MTREEATMYVDMTSRLLRRLLELKNSDAMNAYDMFAMRAIDHHGGLATAEELNAARTHFINELCEYGE